MSARVGKIEYSVEFENRRGKLLRGMLHLPAFVTARRRAPAVVFFHGFTGDRMESHWIFIKCARSLAREGIASLRFDFCGSGESEGEFRDVTLQSEIADARDAIRFLKRQRQVDPRRVGLCGLSLGGAVAACVARSSQAKAVALWSAVAHPALLQELSQERGASSLDGNSSIEYDAREVSLRFLADALKIDPIREIARYRQPTVIIHPEKDQSVPLSHAEDFLHASHAKMKELMVIPGADHTFASIAWEAQVIRQTVEWFCAYL